MSLQSEWWGECKKCRCHGMNPRSFGGRVCICGHKNTAHHSKTTGDGRRPDSPPPSGYGAIATYFLEGELRCAATANHPSESEAEQALLNYCLYDIDGSDAVVRIRGHNKYLALAGAGDGSYLGWASDYTRARAERLAVENCRDRKRPWVYSIHAALLDEHNHFTGEPHC